MGFDGFSFSNGRLEVRRYDRPVAVLCVCGKATTDHSSKERRECRQEAA
jgi:hypothetical protein